MAEHDDKSDGQKPLEGVVLCSTSLGQDTRTRVAKYAVDLGATHLLDLTRDVTHLIVGNVKTPKYQFVAKHRPDVKVLGLEWIEDVRSQWLEGGHVDVESLEIKHKYPVFGGLSICITGFIHLDDRSRFEQLFTSNGAKYSGDLSKQISHLIVAAPEGAKYTHAKQWGISCVTARWVTDSMTRGMALDETLYDPLLPDEQQGRGAFVLSTRAEHVAKRRLQDDSDSHSDNPQLGNRRKLRRTASTRLETHSQDLWHDISARNSAHDDSLVDQWNDDTNAETRPATARAHDREALPNPPAPRTAVDTSAKLFNGWCIYLHRFEQDKERKLQQVLQEQCGAVVFLQEDKIHAAAADTGSQTCVLVSHMPDYPVKRLPRLPPNTLQATEWWVERCIMNRSIVPIEQDRLSRPFWPTCASSFRTLRITSSGLSSLDLRQTAAVIKLQGATYQESLTPTTSVMLGVRGSIKKEKAYYAFKHKIPVVSIQWLWASVDNGAKADFEPYRIAIDSNGDEAGTASADLSGASAHPRDASATVNAGGLLDRNASRGHKSKPRPPAQEMFVQDDDSDCSERAKSVAVQTSHTTSSRVLTDRPPNASPQKKSADSNNKKPVLLDAEKPKLPKSLATESVEPSRNAFPSTTRTADDLNASLASLSNQLLQSRREPSSAAVSQQRRRTKKLGRAASGLLYRSASMVSTDTAHDDYHLDLFQEQPSDRDAASVEREAPPGTQLGYEVPDAEDHRRQMAKKMGLTLADDTGGKKLASLGTVKDSEQVLSHGIVRSRRSRAGR